MSGENTPDIQFDLRADPNNEFRRPREAARFITGESRRLVGLYLAEPRSVAFYMESISGYGIASNFLEGSPRIDWTLRGGDKDCHPNDIIAEGSTFLSALGDNGPQGIIFQVTGLVATDYLLEASLTRTTGRSELSARMRVRTTPWLGSGVPTVFAGNVIG